LLAPCENQERTRLVNGGATPITDSARLTADEPRVRRVTPGSSQQRKPRPAYLRNTVGLSIEN
jgi:hypothetical protein